MFVQTHPAESMGFEKCDGMDYKLWRPSGKSFIKPGSLTAEQLENEAAVTLQRWFRSRFRESHTDVEADASEIKSSRSSDDSDERLDENSLKVVWLPLQEWRQATGFTNLELSSIQS